MFFNDRHPLASRRVPSLNERRRILHHNVTANPTARWTGQQMIEAFPWETAPRFIIRDRDGIYGNEFVGRVGGMGIEQVLISPRSSWQNPLGLAKGCPLPRAIEPPDVGPIDGELMVGGLHHRYFRVAAWALLGRARLAPRTIRSCRPPLGGCNWSPRHPCAMILGARTRTLSGAEFSPTSTLAEVFRRDKA